MREGLVNEGSRRQGSRARREGTGGRKIRRRGEIREGLFRYGGGAVEQGEKGLLAGKQEGKTGFTQDP